MNKNAILKLNQIRKIKLTNLPHHRTYSSSSIQHQKSSDTPWIIGATVVFGSTLAYLFSGGDRTTHAHHIHSRSTPVQHLPSNDDDHKQSFEKEHIPVAGNSEVLTSSPAGEGRPHGEGDKALRQMVKSTEEHSGRQVSTGGLHEHGAIPEKMDEARMNSAKRGSDPDATVDMKTVMAKAKTANQDKKENSKD